MKQILTAIGLLIFSLTYSQEEKSATIYFNFNKYELTDHAKTQLDSLLNAQKQISQSIRLAGYCDAIGTDRYNSLLSVKRVETVKHYLLDHGLEPGVIVSIKGYGERNPLNDNATEEERKFNRRVVISITVTKMQEQVILEKIPLQQKIKDSTIRSGSTIVLQNINFYGGMHQLLSESAPMLNELLESMKMYPGLIIEIQGHICCQPGSGDGYDTQTGDFNLSEARAKAIRDYLIENGIATNRVSYKGFGHSNPLHPYPEQSEKERIENRRVEIKIIAK